MPSETRRRPGMLRVVLIGAQLAMCLMATGCTTLVQPIRTIPAHRVPNEFLAEPQASKVPIDFSRLRLLPQEEYLLGPDDVLGIFIGEVLGSNDEPPPVNLPAMGSDLPPAIGYPIPVQEDGTITLPLIQPVKVEGLTVNQVRKLLLDIYTGQTPDGKSYLPIDSARIIVTLMRRRTVEVTIVRQDNPIVSDQQVQQRAGAGSGRTDYSSRGFVISLEAYKNDVMTALAQTGGLPGVNAKAEITILRGNESRWKERERSIKEWVERYGDCEDPCFSPPPLPDDPSVLRIPLRVQPGVIPEISQEDITLRQGDILFVETRDTEIYYTGGLLRGGQFPLPRDFDLDVLGAIALAGGSVGATSTLGTGVIGSVGAVPPGELIILRPTDRGGQIAISVDLVRAINNPKSRLLVKAGDTLILRYRPEEEVLNFGLGTFFTYGIRELLNNR